MAMVGSITRGEIMGTPGTQIEWVTESTAGESTQPKNNTPLEEDNVIADYSEMIKNSAFVGEYPFDAIIEGLETQFNDYINIEDKTDYVDIFYDQLHASREIAKKIDNDDHLTEIMEALDGFYQRFIDKICELFMERLTLSFMDVESESIDHNDLEFILRRMYEFFILGAKNNFKTVIAADVIPKVQGIKDDNEYFMKVQELVSQHSPLITSFGPMEFLRYRNDVEIIEMFDNSKVVGNFLRKYSPKFYQNEEFMVEVINHITMIQQFKTDLVESVEGLEEASVSQETKDKIVKTTGEYLKMIRELVSEEPKDDSSAISL